MDWIQILQGAALAALVAALTAAANYIQQKAKETKASAALATDDLVDRIIGRNVEAAEKQIGPGRGEEKRALAESGIKDDLVAAGKAIGKSALKTAAGSVGRWIEASVRRKFGK